MKKYEYVIIGGGICGCSAAYELSKFSKNILLIEKNKDVAMGASGAAGAFLSPLLGKPNPFKDLVTQALLYSTQLYKKNFPEFIDNCGTVRIPKDEIDRKKFESYIPYMDFEYSKKDDGYYFAVGSVVNSYQICKEMIKNIESKFDYEVTSLQYDGKNWIINSEIKTENVIVATGYETFLLNESYIKIRAVWGRRINITTTTQVDTNYHKACSLSKSIVKQGQNILSIGATHHRDKQGVENMEANHEELLKKANDIIKLKDVNIIKDYVGARASSVDYFPMLGPLIDSVATLHEFPYLKHGTHVNPQRFTRYKNLSIINGVGGRGFVLAPFLAKELISYLKDGENIDEKVLVDRLFKRDVKRDMVE